MSRVDAARIMEDLVALARQAGEAILEVYAGEFEVDHKADQTPLTQADLASHNLIRDALAELTPEIPLLSEESAELPWPLRQDWREYWLVDPLDGTREFVNRNGEFTVNIALVREHRPVLGVVHVPVRNQTYFGADDHGAWRRDGNGAAVQIHSRKPPRRPLVVVGSRSHANPKLEECLRDVGPYEMVSMGSSLKFCLVAEGAADLYPRLGPTSEWDTAAAQAVVEAAGGAVLGLDGAPIPYNSKASCLNPWFVVCGDPSAGWLGRLNLEL